MSDIDTNDILKNPSELGGCVYYSQNREDLILQSFFPDVENGFYVDVGAFDPDYDSVTKLFYERGWHGINIEPQSDKCELFQKKRKRDATLNIGISSKESELVLRAYKSGGLATFSDKVKHGYEQVPDADTREFTEITVPVRPLGAVLTEQNVSHIHFMKVDVEGLEYEVLASNNWKKFRPEVICIEANHIEKDWRPLLKEVEYEFVFDDGLNHYYSDKHTARKNKFNFVEDVVHVRGGGLRAEHFDRMYRLYEYGVQKSNHVVELAKENDKLQTQLRVAQQKLDAYDGIKVTARQLIRVLKRKMGVK